MRPIDFLPPKYREQSALDQAKLWHLGVVCLFGAVVAAAAICQYSVRRSVAFELAEVDLRYQAAQDHARRLAQAALDLERARGEARLLAYLRHHWPRTQILSLLAAGFPDEVTLTEARIDLARPETSRATAVSEQASASPANPAVAVAKPALAVADLVRLRTARDGARSVLQLSGSTRDVSALHSYLAELAAHPLVAKAELLSLEQAGPAGGSLGESALFRARVSIRPDYTQSGGPAWPAEHPPVAAQPRQNSESPAALAGGAP